MLINFIRKSDKIVVLIGSLMALIASSLSAEDINPSINVRNDMTLVYRAFRDLQPFIANKNLFLRDENSQIISNNLTIMQQRFHRVEVISPKYTAEPGFSSTIKMMTDMLDDVKNRFVEDKKDYSWWRLKSSYNYCVSCHTRFEVKMDFNDASLDLSTLDAFEQGEFYLATRQFDKARDAFLKVLNNPALHMRHLDALRKWLVIYTRVQPAPQQAIIELNKIRAQSKLLPYQVKEVQSWLQSLRRWQNESKLEIEPLRKAEALIAQGVSLDEALSNAHGQVELLRATAILHKYMSENSLVSKAPRAKVLYQLGLAYSHLPSIFATDLPEVFLEQCIRENPGSEEAKKAFLLFQDVISQGYTGSGGTKLPDEVLLNIKELYGLAYGKGKLEGRV